VAGPARPSLDVDGTLDDDEWLELYHESLRVGAFWPRLALVTVILLATIGVIALLGAPPVVAASGILIVFGMLVTYTVGYAWLGPQLRRRRLAQPERMAHWRISADRLRTHIGGTDVDLAWRDVDRVRLTRRLVTFELTGGRGLLALPRRTATQLGETLILGWAADEGTPVTRRTSA
jgi:hypothetical protein